jgi:hypothetical protein
MPMHNSTAHEILKTQVRMKRSKAFDMRYHWLKDRISRLNLISTGHLAVRTRLTTTANIFHLPITSLKGIVVGAFSVVLIYYMPFRHICKGVLLLTVVSFQL